MGLVWRHTVAICIVAFVCNPLFAEEYTLENVAKKALVAWKDYDERVGPLTGTIEAKYELPNTTRQFKFEIMRKGVFVRCLSHQVNGGIATKPMQATRLEGFVSNDKYAFVVGRLDREGNPWALTGFAPHQTSDKVGHDAILSDVDGSTFHAKALFNFQNASMVELFTSPRFKVTGVKEVTTNGVKLLSIEFENVHAVEEMGFTPIQRGTINLDPGAAFCIAYANIESKYTNGTVKCETETKYRVDELGIPWHELTTHVARNTDGENRGTFVKYRISSTVSRVDSLDKSQFYLSAFGLPEPKLPWSRNFWLLACGLFGILLITVGTWMRGKYSAKMLTR